MFNELSKAETERVMQKMYEALRGIDTFYVFFDTTLHPSRATGARCAIHKVRDVLNFLDEVRGDARKRKLCVKAARVDCEATVDIILNSGRNLSPDDIERLEGIAARPDNDCEAWEPKQSAEGSKK